MEKHTRSVAKAISWRVTGTVDTFVISFLLSGSVKLAGGIASVEVMTKMVLYYLHERAWSRISWGRHGAATRRSSEHAAAEGYVAGPAREANAAEVA